MTIKVELFPNPKSDLIKKNGDNPHFQLLIAAWNNIPNKIVEIYDYNSSKTERPDALLVLWPDSLFERCTNSFIYRLAKFLSIGKKKLISSAVLNMLVNLECMKIRRIPYPVFWQIHEIHGHQVFEKMKDIEFKIRAALYEKSSKIFLTENSTKIEILKAMNYVDKPFAKSPLGGYRDFYGPKIATVEAKKSLGIDSNLTTILIFGRARKDKDFSILLEQLAKKGFFIIFAGQGYVRPKISEDMMMIHDNFVAKSEVAKLFSAADYVLKPEAGYLNSGVMRLAVSYSKPVIAHPYGGVVEMAKGCLIEIGDDETSYTWLEGIPKFGTPEYLELEQEANRSDCYRSWELAARIFHDEILNTLSEEKNVH